MATNRISTQIDLMNRYVARVGEVFGVTPDCGCDICSKKRSEVALLLGEYGAEYAKDLTTAVLQGGIATRTIERKLDAVLAILDLPPELATIKPA